MTDDLLFGMTEAERFSSICEIVGGALKERTSLTKYQLREVFELAGGNPMTGEGYPGWASNDEAGMNWKTV